ncbi:MAG: DNA-protecting protein DprA [Candidatus Nealsonbacteria bacterium]|nr:DNA-protecting protein DprA [Candidatus Nealsonbacteria bacterium]
MNVINIDDKKYPQLLKKIGKDAPKQLYYKGAWDDDIFKNCLAVVGSRRLTSYGRQVTERLVTEIAALGITIVSGFMYGGDATAHKAAVKAGGRTIAVMPCGIERIHPEYQQDLYVEILNNNGLIISEYEGDQMPVNWMYPRRNRIVAGLSRATLVIEAGLKSGTLITANLAKKFGRKIFAVPGPITSEVSKGTSQLLKEGAALVTSAKDILDFFGVSGLRSLASKKEAKLPGGDIEQKIIEQLKRESMEIDALARSFNMPVSKISAILSIMQLRGLIRQEGSKYYLI